MRIRITHRPSDYWGSPGPITCEGTLTLDGFRELLDGGYVECGVCYRKVEAEED